jgi:hypothetical protein
MKHIALLLFFLLFASLLPAKDVVIVNPVYEVKTTGIISIILDWEEFLTANRLRDRQYTFKDIRFFGPTAVINQELTTFFSQQQELPQFFEYQYFINLKSPNLSKIESLAISSSQNIENQKNITSFVSYLNRIISRKPAS